MTTARDMIHRWKGVFVCVFVWFKMVIFRADKEIPSSRRQDRLIILLPMMYNMLVCLLNTRVQERDLYVFHLSCSVAGDGRGYPSSSGWIPERERESRTIECQLSLFTSPSSFIII